MATQATRLSSILVIKYNNGVDAEGKDIIKSQRFAKVKTTAVEQELLDVALEMGKLLGKILN